MTIPETPAAAVRLAAMLLVAVLATACASGGVETPAPAVSRDVIDPPRGSRGNPPFYEVFGRRYHVLETSAGYRERGTASWYGRDFHGKPTSGGEPYDMHALTAAHKTLPIPTWVEVRNLSNGKRVIVRVNDRGPFVGDRIIDLSYRAAQDLEMIRDGTARVEVRALGAPAAGGPVMAEAAAPERAPSRGVSLISEAVADAGGPEAELFRQAYVQVGAFSEERNAARMLERLRSNGFEDSFIDARGRAGARLHRVRIGPLDGDDEFDRIRARLAAIGVEGGRLVMDP